MAKTRQAATVFSPAGSAPTAFDLEFSLATIATIGPPDGGFGPVFANLGLELDGYPRAQTNIGVELQAPFGGELAIVTVVKLEEGGVVMPPGVVKPGERRHGRLRRPAPGAGNRGGAGGV